MFSTTNVSDKWNVRGFERMLSYEHINRLLISVQFRSFLLSCKTGKTFIWISPKVHRFWNWNYRLTGSSIQICKNLWGAASTFRPMETSWRNTASRYCDNVHGYHKWPVWGKSRVDQPTSTCLKWHTSITVYLQRTSDRSNSHERRCSIRNLDDMHTIWGICL